MENDELILLEIKDIHERVKEIHDFMFVGNGKPGLCTRMEAVEATTATIKRLMWLVIAGIITIVTSSVAMNLLHIKIG
jgi:hypothetical protein